ncbi:MAG: SpoIID/LytB domain-containing protein [Clostridium sp.]|nr:SpoIID/LytB domain-containing protein [Clostridium sp.]
MNKLRVFQTFKKKRIVSGFFPKNLGTILLLLLLLPYLITSLSGNVKEGGAGKLDIIEGSFHEGLVFVNNTTAYGSESIPLEAYVADRLARSIDEDFELETLKAQAVLIRSSLWSSLYKEENYKRAVSEIKVEDADYGSMPASEKILEAVAETMGVCLTCEEQPVNGAYFAVSNGATRNGEELFSEEYPYLKSVLCARDFLSEAYTSSLDYSRAEFDKIWGEIPSFTITEEEILKKGKVTAETELEDVTLYRDSVGYVLYLLRNGKFVLGEQFRESFRLSSASFHLSGEGNQVHMAVKGEGHGFGMSQFGANEMAKEGSDYIEILNYFFDSVIITKFE